MTVRELINKLLDRPMDNDVMLCYNKEHLDKYGDIVHGYAFHIDGVEKDDIIFTDWRDNGFQKMDDDEFTAFIKNSFDEYRAHHPNTGIEKVGITRWKKTKRGEMSDDV